MSYATREIPPHVNTSIKTHARSGSLSSIKSPASPFDPLYAALSSAQSRYTLSNPKSLKAHNEACQDFPGGNTRTVLHASPFPLTFANGKGCELTTLDGDVYIDFLGEYTAGIYGHSNEIIASAVSEAMKNGWNFGGPNQYERELASKVTKRFGPSGIELVRFTNSGTEANTMAIAASVAYTGRKKLLVFRNGYHGGTLSFPSSLNKQNVNLPHDFVLAPYNDISGTQSVIDRLPSNSLAAVIVELVQGSGGAIVGSVDFLRYLNTAAHKIGALFIVDEVMTSRLSYHGLSASLGLKPDLLTLGKWIGGGMTFGAFGGRKEGGVMSMFDPRSGVLGHSGTFNNNVVTMAAGCAGVDIYNEEAVVLLNALGETLRAGVEAVLKKHGITKISEERCPEKNEDESPFTGIKSEHVTNGISVESLSISEERKGKSTMWVSGQGSMMCIHFGGENEASLMPLFWHHMLENGIYMAQRGFIALNLELTTGHVEQFITAVDAFVGKYRMVLTS